MKKEAISENQVKKTYLIPEDICEKLEQMANENKRSINNELVYILDSFIKMPILLETGIKKEIQKIADEKGWSISYTVNFYLGLKLTDENKRIE